MSFFADLKKIGSKTAVIDKDGNKYSYLKLNIDCNEFAYRLGNEKKKLVMILARNNYESLVGYLGTIGSNNACLMLSNKINSTMLQYLIQIYQPDLIWKPNLENNDNYTLEKHKVERDIHIHPDLKLLLPTSGSTGSNKLVRLSGRNIVSNADSIATYLNLDESETAITSLPISYSYGLSIVNSHLNVGATILLTDDDVIQKGFWDFFRAYNATSLCGVPYTYEIYKRLKILDMGLNSLRYMTQAGGKMSSDLIEYFGKELLKRELKLFVMYGQTEASPRISYLPPERCLEKSSSIGIPIPGGNLYISDENNNTVCEPFKTGELVYEGPNVMMGYSLVENDLSKGDELNGVLKTGDLGYMDSDGYFFITGRINRIIKVNGYRVSLDDIEGFINSAGIECIVGGNDGCLLVGVTDKTKLEKIKKILWETYKFHHSLYKIINIEKILRSDNGKPLYVKTFEEVACTS